MSNQNQKPNNKYNLADRTAEFGEAIIEFINKLSKNQVNQILTNQLIRSATSVGANYMEADAGVSKKDFKHKIGLCKKEAKETMHWLRMVAKNNPKEKKICRVLYKEAHELVLIFSAICRSKKKG